MARDWRDERIAELDAENAELRAQLKDALRRVRELEVRLGQSSSNSNQPPSKDTPEQRRNRSKRPPSTRKRGAQPGHEAHERELVDPEKVTRFVDCYAEECEECAAKLPRTRDSEAERRQVVEMPEIVPDVTELVMHAVECDHCGHRTRGRPPVGTPESMFGPRLLAFVGLVTGAYKLSRRDAVAFLHEVFGIRVSLGALSNAEARISRAIEPAVQDARRFVEAQPFKHVDATPWSNRGQARTLWTISTTFVTVFAIVADGTSDKLRGLFQRIRGKLISDRGSVFGFWRMSMRQICWAHLIRKFASFDERGGSGSQLAHQLRGTTELMFERWHHVRDGTMSRAAFRRWMEAVRERVERLLERGVALRVKGFSGSCADILKHRDALWTFVDHAGIDPTNNLAERDLRPFVLWRQRSFGSQSARGELYAANIMTVVHTLRKQKRPLFAYLSHACASHLLGAPPPSLLPGTP